MDLAILGMWEGLSAPDGGHEYLVNVVRDDEGYWETCPGVVLVDGNSLGQPLRLVSFHRRGEQRWLLLEHIVGGTTTALIDYYDWRAQDWVRVAERDALSNGFGSQFLNIGGWLYILTPQNAPIRWNGERVQPVGWQQATPGLVATGSDNGFDHIEQAGATYLPLADGYEVLNTVHQRGIGESPAADNNSAETESPDTHWVRGYARTFVNEVGAESPPSALAWASGTNEAGTDKGRTVAHVHGEAGPAHAVGQRLWCTRNVYDLPDPTLAPLYLLAEIPHAGAFDWVDHTPDGELGIELVEDDLGQTPPGAYVGAYWSGALWLVGTDDPSQLRYSAPGLTEQFPPSASLQLGTSSSGRIVACVPVQRALVVFKERAVFAVVGDFVNGFRSVTLSEEHGTTAPHAVALVPGLGIVYLDTADGPSVIVGTATDDQPTGIRRLDGLRRTWRRYVGHRQEGARVLYDPDAREIWWHVCQGGDTQPQLGIVYHLDTQAWSLRPDWRVFDMVRHAGRTLLAYYNDGDVQVGVLSRASQLRTNDGAAPVRAEWHTRWLEWPGLITAHTAELVVEAIGRVEVSVALRANRQQQEWDQTELTDRQQVHSEDDRPEWGAALWSATATWTDHEPARVPVDLHGATRAHQHQLLVRSERMRLYGMRLIVEPSTSPVHRRERAGGRLP